MNKRIVTILLVMFFLTGSSIALGQASSTMDPNQAGPTVKKMIKLSQKNLKRAAVIACVQRGWAITSVSGDTISATYRNAKVEIKISKGKVTATIVEGKSSQRWVDGITRDTFVALLYLSK